MLVRKFDMLRKPLILNSAFFQGCSTALKIFTFNIKPNFNYKVSKINAVFLYKQHTTFISLKHSFPNKLP